MKGSTTKKLILIAAVAALAACMPGAPGGEPPGARNRTAASSSPIRRLTDMEEAIRGVEAGRAQRICAPGKWVVWREGDAVMTKDLGHG